MAENSINRYELVRGLGLLAAISIIVGNVIGTGVFLKARVMTCNVGSPEAVILVWVAAGILSLAGALTYAELSAMKPQAGGEYVFLRDAYGRIWSFLYGWMQIFIAKTGSQASVAVAFAIFANDLLGGTLRQVILQTSVFGYEYELTTLQVVAVAMIVIITVINLLSVSTGGNIATVLTFVKIALVLLVGIGAFLLADGNFAHFGTMNDGGTCEGVENAVKYGAAGFTFIGGFSAAMLGALWGYDGWNNLTLVAGEVKNPQRNIPLALIGGTILIIILYVFVHFAYFYVLSPTEIASVSASSSVAKEVAVRFLGAGALDVAALDQPERDVLPDLQAVEQGGALEQHAELAHDAVAVAGAEADSFLAVDLDRPGVGLHQPDDVLDQHRLAGARPADHDQGFAAPQLQVDAVEHQLRPEALAQAADRDLGSGVRVSHTAKNSSVMM